MEREPSQARDIRMAGVRPGRDRGRHGHGSEDDRPAEQRRRSGAPRRSDPQAGRLHRVRSADRIRRDPESQAHDPRPRLPGRGPRRRRRGLAVQPDPQPAFSARAREPRSGHARRAHRARRVRHERHAQVGGEPDRPVDQRRRVGGKGEPAVLRRRGRRGEHGPRDHEAVQYAAVAGGRAVGAVDAAGAGAGARVRVAVGGVGAADGRAHVRDRDDDRGRGRDDRLAGRPAGSALEARRSGREGADPAAWALPAPGRRGSGCGPRS